MLNVIKGQLQGRVALVVEDEPDSLEIAARLLKLAGATVLTAANGREGVEVAAAHRPDFILVDLSMPVMDGWEMQCQLKGNPDMTTIPVIALTAHAMQNVKEQVMEAGFAAHISKPFDPRRFVTQVLQITEEFRGPSTAVEAGH